MPRQNRRRDGEPPRPLVTGAAERRERWRGEDYAVRAVSGSATAKAYRCPGCDQVIAPGVPHIVAWPAREVDAADRRHWHTPCWRARGRRVAGPRRPGRSPRY